MGQDSDVVAFLRQYLSAEAQVKRLRGKIEELSLPFYGTGGDGMPRSPTPRSPMDAIDGIIDKHIELEDEIKALQKIQREVKDVIDGADKKDVLRYRYIEGMSWRDVANITGYSLPYVYKLHGAALDEIRGKYD